MGQQSPENPSNLCSLTTPARKSVSKMSFSVADLQEVLTDHFCGTFLSLNEVVLIWLKWGLYLDSESFHSNIMKQSSKPDFTLCHRCFMFITLFFFTHDFSGSWNKPCQQFSNWWVKEILSMFTLYFTKSSEVLVLYLMCVLCIFR